MLREEILPLTQYYAYIEISDAPHEEGYPHLTFGKDLWRGYGELALSAPNFAMKRVADRADVYPVFRQLFAKSNSRSVAT